MLKTRKNTEGVETKSKRTSFEQRFLFWDL